MEETFKRCLGVELSGPRSYKSVVSVIDYHEESGKVILHDISSTENSQISPDETLIRELQLIKENSTSEIVTTAVNAPLSMPPFFKEEPARSDEISWMQAFTTKGKLKHVVPYLQRPEDLYLRYGYSEKFESIDSMSANRATLSARAMFLKKYFCGSQIEVYAPATIRRIAYAFNMSRKVSQHYSSLTNGEQARRQFLEALERKMKALFIYEDHLDKMIENIYYFRAFVSSLNAFLFYKDQCEPKPRGFPESSGWICLPKTQINC